MKHIEDVSFWQQLNPSLEIESTQPFPTPIIFSEERLSEISDIFWREGYLHLPPVFEQGELTSLKQAIIKLTNEGFPPVFIYLYDAPWIVFHRLKNLITHFLGGKTALLPHLWAWHINMDQESAGWPPHVDCVGETRFDDLLMSLSLWVPLTDTTPENGCMHVLPRPFETQYNPSVSDADQIKLQDVRALPAETGSVLGWPQDLWHWSGRSSVLANEPRISLSLEFQNSSFEAMAEPLLDTSKPPSFENRLTLIAQQFGKYTHMVETPEHLKDFISARLKQSDS
ncbi:MAG: phytanoyl-CoA dioxygenase family protein [Alphaproteobacteria bacterium]|nr:phytanoyl-CoA dioxygenase family protein [Rhodospirillales bacterium]MCW9044858.1 phytanoyl-CoA dioxygenase family protein [Alphaproteobacteria bacterium]